MYGENLLPCFDRESIWCNNVTPVATIKICDDLPVFQKKQKVDAWLLEVKRCTQVHLIVWYEPRFDGARYVIHTHVFAVGNAATHARVQTAMANIGGISGTIELKPFVDPSTATNVRHCFTLDIMYGNPEFMRKRHTPAIDSELNFIVT